MNLLTCYIDVMKTRTRKPSFTNAETTNFCLAPLSCALNRRVAVINSATSANPKLSFMADTINDTAVRVICALVCIVWSPLIVVGLAGRLLSPAHARLRQEEASYYARCEKVKNEVLEPFQKESHFTEKVKAFALNHQEKCGLDLKEKLSQALPEPNSLTYTELLKLKRALRALAQLDTHFIQQHQNTRKIYYERFALEHAVRNLKEKGLIPSLKQQDKLEYTQDACDEIFRSLKSDSPPTVPNFFHGTQSPTLACAMQTDQSLKPSGALRATGKISLTGEAAKGSFGINEKALSGAKEPWASITYAHGGIGYHDEITELCVRAPQESAPILAQQFDEWLNKTFATTADSLTSNIYYMDIKETDDKASPQYLNNFHRQMKIVWMLAPHEFEEHILPKVKQLVERLESFQAPIAARHNQYSNALNRLIENKFRPILSFKETLPSFSDEEKALITAHYPIVFGASNITYKEFAERADNVAYSVKSGEYAFRGNLKIGQDVTHLFVPQERIRETKDYLTQKKITQTEVTSIAALELAHRFPCFKEEKSKWRTYKTTATTTKL